MVGRDGGVDRDLPDVLLLEEDRRIRDVIRGELRRLHLEQTLRITEVRHQVGGCLRQRREQIRERRRPRLYDRVVLVDDVVLHGSVVRVDRHLHGVGHVVGAALNGAVRRRAEVDLLRVRVFDAGRVRIPDPRQASIHHREVRILVEGQERRRLR